MQVLDEKKIKGKGQVPLDGVRGGGQSNQFQVPIDSIES